VECGAIRRETCICVPEGKGIGGTAGATSRRADSGFGLRDGSVDGGIAERGVEVLGVDRSEEMISQARRKFPALKFEAVDGLASHFSRIRSSCLRMTASSRIFSLTCASFAWAMERTR
jgi:hypothetical protein